MPQKGRVVSFKIVPRACRVLLRPLTAHVGEVMKRQVEGEHQPNPGDDPYGYFRSLQRTRIRTALLLHHGLEVM